jgi:exoribonuclease-2
MNFPLHSLVEYRKRPAIVLQSGEKLEIELEDGNRARVRPKDVALLHPGPLHSLEALGAPPGEVELAWEMLSEAPELAHSLEELAELAYGEFSPSSAWATWLLVEDGLYFRGTPEAIFARSAAEVNAQQAARQARQEEALVWKAFVDRARNGQINLQQDERYLREVEDLAYGRRSVSRLLSELGRSTRPETAHAFLLETGYWRNTTNPYPVRLGLPIHNPESILPALPDEPRLDLTGLTAYAIDDCENKDPDDAISLESIDVDAAGNLLGGQLWVHVADAAALLPPDSPADQEASARGATLYLPEGAVNMLPWEAVQRLGLGLQEISPALSFRLAVDDQAQITSIDIQPSWVRVERLSYEQADERLATDTRLQGLQRLETACLARRQANGALSIDLPEAIMHVTDGRVQIRPLPRLRSRDLVREAMLLAGEAVGRFAMENKLPFPFAIQDAPDSPIPPLEEADLAGRFAIRRQLKRGGVSSHPGLHAGLGLNAYSRVTSPLRRYLDLAAHQQLRAFLRSQPGLNEQDMLERLGMAEAAVRNVNQAETLSRRHWTLVYFLQNPAWQGEAILVEKQGLRSKVIIPELAFETIVHLRQDLPLNSRLRLAFGGAKLADLEASFTILT